jgi:hypothetical protein
MSETQSAQKETTTVNLLDLPVTNENEALNVMVGFLGLAQKRGCFAINEAAKIYECVKFFQKPASNTGSN